MNFFEKFVGAKPEAEKDKEMEETIAIIREEAEKTKTKLKESGASEEKISEFDDAIERKINRIRELGKEKE